MEYFWLEVHILEAIGRRLVTDNLKMRINAGTHKMKNYRDSSMS